MAEGYYHVPQQSRRDKLRVNVVEPFLPFYDSSSSPSFIIPSDLSPTQHNKNNQAFKPNLGSCSMKEQQQQGSNLMMTVSFSNNSSSVVSLLSHHHHAYLDPNNGSPSFPLNLNPAAGTNTIQVISNSSSSSNNSNNNPFLYQAQNNLQNIREFDSGIINDVLFNKKAEPLSLSLSSSSQHKSSTGLPLELNLLQRYGSVIYGDHNNNKVGVCGGYDDSVMKKYSRFLKPAQQLLEEMCYVGGVCGVEKGVVVADASLMMEPLPERRLISEEEDHSHGGDGVEGRNYKSRLLTMLDEVYRRYRKYYQQMHVVVISFEYISGLSNAAPYASLAIKAMSKHFRFLKKAITNQLQFNNKAHSHISSSRMDEYSPRFGAGNSDTGGGEGHHYSQRQGFLEHQPVWRPQRGLPERAVTVLRAWLFEHFLHPYPTDTDKLMLAKQTGLSRSQVSNWFINARVRLWKPMVEEIHMLETRQVHKNPQKEEQHCRNKSSSDHLPSDTTTSLVSENPSTSNDKFQGATTYKHTMNVELPNIQVRSQEQLNLPFTGNNNNNNNSVSLTLGLYQNHGIGLAEPFPLSAAQRFGLASLETNNNEGYVMSSGFESQSRHFGRDVIGGQLFHDFVG